MKGVRKGLGNFKKSTQKRISGVLGSRRSSAVEGNDELIEGIAKLEANDKLLSKLIKAVEKHSSSTVQDTDIATVALQSSSALKTLLPNTSALLEKVSHFHTQLKAAQRSLQTESTAVATRLREFRSTRVAEAKKVQRDHAQAVHRYKHDEDTYNAKRTEELKAKMQASASDMQQLEAALATILQDVNKEAEEKLASELNQYIAGFRTYHAAGAEQSKATSSAFVSLNSQASMQAVMPAAGKQANVLGAPLDTLCELNNSAVPAFVEEACKHLEEKGSKVVGIFRPERAPPQATDAFREALEAGDYNLARTNVMAIAAVLVEFFQSLPEPLIPYALYNEFLDAGNYSQDDMARELSKLVDQLPSNNRATLERLLRMLGVISAGSRSTRMGPARLGAVWGPRLLRAEKFNEETASADMCVSSAVLMVLIQEREAVFGGDGGGNAQNSNDSESKSERDGGKKKSGSDKTSDDDGERRKQEEEKARLAEQQRLEREKETERAKVAEAERLRKEREAQAEKKKLAAVATPAKAPSGVAPKPAGGVLKMKRFKGKGRKFKGKGKGKGRRRMRKMPKAAAPAKPTAAPEAKPKPKPKPSVEVAPKPAKPAVKVKETTGDSYDSLDSSSDDEEEEEYTDDDEDEEENAHGVLGHGGSTKDLEDSAMLGVLGMMLTGERRDSISNN